MGNRSVSAQAVQTDEWIKEDRAEVYYLSSYITNKLTIIITSYISTLLTFKTSLLT